MADPQARARPLAFGHSLDAADHEVFTELDRLCVVHGLEKIKTIGDAYMVAAGVPEGRDDHADAAVTMGLSMIDAIAGIATKLGLPIAVRVGVHSGPVVAGVLGTKKLVYDLWGDTVNTAARMESHGIAGCVHISETTRDRLRLPLAVETRGEHTRGMTVVEWRVPRRAPANAEVAHIADEPLLRNVVLDALARAARA